MSRKPTMKCRATALQRSIPEFFMVCIFSSPLLTEYDEVACHCGLVYQALVWEHAGPIGPECYGRCLVYVDGDVACAMQSTDHGKVLGLPGVDNDIECVR